MVVMVQASVQDGHTQSLNSGKNQNNKLCSKAHETITALLKYSMP